ncbi:ABC transporter substrate-binding protein [Luteitalea sp. TBR-22]|uniref:ABC transporter substrate-binding protein n=1 Tax=Luteitalea sp. TBR-22 TaxID=2802971 RepID=UPI001EF624B8|nr:ABC transporter substrate-binding protein [Luteitalea sp. TBR-22]
MKRLAGLLLVLLIVCAGLWLLRDGTRGGGSTGTPTEFVATLRAEPRSLVRLAANDRATLVANQLLHDVLVRVNHVTQSLEPALAASWVTLDEGRRFRVTLRPEARFSDGTPVTADDVAFSLEVVFDPKLGSPLADTFTLQGQPLTARVVDPRTVDLAWPAPYGPGMRPLHALPIVPRARYATALANGTFADKWAPSADPAGMVGAGPFVLERHEPGVALHLARNPHYWRTGDDGAPRPRVDRIRLDVVPSQDAEMLRLRSGQADVITAELRPDDLPEARALAAQGQLQLFDLGPSLEADMLWFNLRGPGIGNRESGIGQGTPSAGEGTPGAGSRAQGTGTQPGGDAPPERRGWLKKRELREAISMAVDRTAFINAVYRGAGVQVASMITPGNHAWAAADIAPRPYSPTMAGELLDRIGVRDRNGDGVREDVFDEPARFTLLVQQGHTIRQRAAAVLQEALAKIGLQVEIVSLDPKGLQQRMLEGRYEAMYHALPGTDTDPSGLMEFWLSSGRMHLWNPGQPAAQTKWEDELDILVTRQLATTDQAERQRLMVQAQKLLDAELPVVVFAVPRVTIATSGRLTHVAPGLLAPQVLWNAAEIGVR